MVKFMSNDDVSKAVLLLKQTLPEMSRRNIAATPENYAVWYEYVSRENMDLVAAIDELERSHSPLTNDVHRELYLKFIASSREAAINKLSDSVRDIMHEFLRNLCSEGSALSNYAQILSAFSSQVDTAQSLDAIREMLGQVLAETHKREDATLQMQLMLETMGNELRSLREEVARINAEASTDPLTRVANRRAFDIEYERQVHNSQQHQTTLALLMLDIDHFKSFNDRFGHLIGDKVLRFFATLLKNNIKGHDTVSRYGGEEFTILLPDTDYEGAMSVAENIRSRLAKQTLSDSAEKIQLGTITVSIGVACLHPEDSSELLLRRSDRCMQAAKSNGRNLVVGEKDMKSPIGDGPTFI